MRVRGENADAGKVEVDVEGECYGESEVEV